MSKTETFEEEEEEDYSHPSIQCKKSTSTSTSSAHTQYDENDDADDGGSAFFLVPLKHTPVPRYDGYSFHNNFDKLSDDEILCILSFLTIHENLKAGLVCKKWRQICGDHLIWSNLVKVKPKTVAEEAVLVEMKQPCFLREKYIARKRIIRDLRTMRLPLFTGYSIWKEMRIVLIVSYLISFAVCATIASFTIPLYIDFNIPHTVSGFAGAMSPAVAIALITLALLLEEFTWETVNCILQARFMSTRFDVSLLPPASTVRSLVLELLLYYTWIPVLVLQVFKFGLIPLGSRLARTATPHLDLVFWPTFWVAVLSSAIALVSWIWFTVLRYLRTKSWRYHLFSRKLFAIFTTAMLMCSLYLVCEKLDVIGGVDNIKNSYRIGRGWPTCFAPLMAWTSILLAQSSVYLMLRRPTTLRLYTSEDWGFSSLFFSLGSGYFFSGLLTQILAARALGRMAITLSFIPVHSALIMLLFSIFMCGLILSISYRRNLVESRTIFYKIAQSMFSRLEDFTGVTLHRVEEEGKEILEI